MLSGLAVLASCSTHDIIESADGKGLVLRLRVGMTHTTRATGDNPTGGEHGDGLRRGEHHENDVESIVLFYYNHPAGINAPDDTPVSKIAYIDGINFHPTANENTAEIELNALLYQHHANDQFIVSVNSEDFGAASLGELRNKFMTYAWQSSADGVKANFENFVMSNETNSLYYQRTSSVDDPDVIEISVERIMGRLDFCVDGATVSGSNLLYRAADGGANTKVGDVLVSHVRAFNVMQPAQMPYLIKRLGTSSAPSTWNYLEEEWKPAQSLVVEPRTWFKGEPNTTEWYGATAYGQAIALGDSWFRDEDRVHVNESGNGFTDGFSVDMTDPSDIQHFYVVDYANENTMTPENTTSQTTTGLLIKAVYKPEVVYKASGDPRNPVADETYATGQTFWRYQPIVAKFDETKALYFSSEAAVLAYQAACPEQLAEITKYEGGKCYYPVFLRHDNSAKTPDLELMEFGIVRNNIYRLKVEFTGPGYNDIPDDVEPEGIRPYIFVRRWYKINHPEIEI